MQAYVKKYEAQGKKCLFVGALGDNFYASGLSDAGQWKSQWGDVYGTATPGSGLYDIPWLATMGNHDLGSADPACACGGKCNQFNGVNRPNGTEKYWMKDHNWNYYIKEVELEIIGLNTNIDDLHGLGGNGCGGGAKLVCEQCGGQDKVGAFLTEKSNEGKALLKQRAQQSAATTAVILQHYPGVGSSLKQQFESDNNGKAKVITAYGHAHDQVCHGGAGAACDVILSGGGGGWGGGRYFGFTAIHLTDDGGFETVLETPEVRFPQHSCSYLTHEPETDTVVV